MIKPTIEDALNNQLNAELDSSYLYLSMAAHFEAKNFRGMARWMKRNPVKNGATPRKSTTSSSSVPGASTSKPSPSQRPTGTR